MYYVELRNTFKISGGTWYFVNRFNIKKNQASPLKLKNWKTNIYITSQEKNVFDCN